MEQHSLDTVDSKATVAFKHGANACCIEGLELVRSEERLYLLQASRCFLHVDDYSINLSIELNSQQSGDPVRYGLSTARNIHVAFWM